MPSCGEITPGFKAATSALGWDLLEIPSKSAEPGPAIQQALDQGANYIALTGTPIAAYAEGAKAAKAKGVPIFSCYTTDVPSAESNLLLSCGRNYTKAAQMLGDWTVVDSKQNANVLMINIRDFPILVNIEESYKAELIKNCPKCTFDVLNTTIADLVAGKIPAGVVSKMQANPKINYIAYAFGGLNGGVYEAVKAAGLADKTKFIGGDFDKDDLQAITDGTNSAWYSNPKEYSGWLMTDAAARLSVGMKLDEEVPSSVLPTFLVTSKATAAPMLAAGNWPGPATMAAQFKKLWLVG